MEGTGVLRDERDQLGVEGVRDGHVIGGVAFADTKSGFRTTITASFCAKDSVTRGLPNRGKRSYITFVAA